MSQIITPVMRRNEVFSEFFQVWKKICIPLALLQLVLFQFISLVATAANSYFERLGDSELFDANVKIFAVFLFGFAFLFSFFCVVMAVKASCEIIQNGGHNWWSTLRFSAKKFFSVLGASLIIGFAGFMGGLLFIIPGIIVMVGAMFAYPIMVVENTSIMESWKRSRALVKSHYLPFFGYSSIVFVLQAALMFVPFLNFLSATLWPVFVSVLYFKRLKMDEEVVVLTDS